VQFHQENSFRSKFQSATFRLLVALAVALPAIVVGNQVVHLVTAYREATWYTQLAEWYDRQAEESKRQASSYLRYAEQARGSDEADRWRQKAEAKEKQRQEEEKKSLQAKQMKSRLGSFWG
jgi:hypothetical protein